MGKAEDEQPLPSTTLDPQGTNSGAGGSNGCCLSCSRLVNFRCVFVLVLGVAVILSAIFWLPFFHFGDHKDLDLDFEGHDIVASFMLRKPAAFLQDHILELQGDIFDEMSFSSTKVEVIQLEPSPEPNRTKVVFAVESELTTQSLIKDSFMYLINHQSSFQLTASLFGEPSSFEVLKFRGGITASPEQKAFLMQSGQIRFNFTLNFSIDQILTKFNELRSQLKTGLHLAPFEILYVRLTNVKGSTVTPPTTVESQVLLAVGIDPSKRLKQLAQTITSSHSKNLGLNNTVFGRVKQVQLSSVLQHSLGGDGSDPSPSPSPTPFRSASASASASPSLSPSPSPSSSPSPQPQSHFHHHHHRHHHHHDASPSISPSPSPQNHGLPTGRGSPTPAPVPAPAPAPAPLKSKVGPPPSCHFGHGNRFPWKHNHHSYVAPSPTPGYAPTAAPSQPLHTKYPPPKTSPVPAASPPRNVAFGHSHPTHPPSNGEIHARPPDVMSIVSPLPSPSSAGISSSNLWALLLVIVVVMLH